MRKIKELQLSLGEVPIEKIRFNPKSRDDIPAVLRGLQYIYVNTKTREELFSLLEKEFLAEVNFDVGRPGTSCILSSLNLIYSEFVFF